MEEANKYVWYLGHSNQINNMGKTHSLSMDHWMQTMERSQNLEDVIKTYDNVTKLFGENPTPEKILEMERNKGITYQRKGNDNPVKPYHNIPTTITPPTSKLSIELGSWVSNAKVLVSVIELIKIPSQKEKLLRDIEGPKEKSVERHKKYYEDAPVILQGTDHNRGNGSHQPFFIYLSVNNQRLQNYILDSGASSNVMTWKVMEQLNLRFARPYHSVCAMDSREIKVHGLIKDLQVHLAVFSDI
jgi:hypothetical protein